MTSTPRAPVHMEGTLRAEIEKARHLLRLISAADMGKIAATVLPAVEVGEAQPNQLILIALIRAELARRERA